MHKKGSSGCSRDQHGAIAQGAIVHSMVCLFALHMAHQFLSDILYGPLSLTGVLSKRRGRNNALVPLGMAETPKEISIAPMPRGV